MKKNIFISAIALILMITLLCACGDKNVNNSDGQTTETTVAEVDKGTPLDIDLSMVNKIGVVSADLSHGEIEYKTTDSGIISDFLNQVRDSKAVKIDNRYSGAYHFILYNNDDILYHIYHNGNYFSVGGINADFKSNNFEDGKILAIYEELLSL